MHFAAYIQRQFNVAVLTALAPRQHARMVSYAATRLNLEDALWDATKQSGSALHAKHALKVAATAVQAIRALEGYANPYARLITTAI
jgi:hypothetical protein